MVGCLLCLGGHEKTPWPIGSQGCVEQGLRRTGSLPDAAEYYHDAHVPHFSTAVGLSPADPHPAGCNGAADPDPGAVRRSQICAQEGCSTWEGRRGEAGTCRSGSPRSWLGLTRSWMIRGSSCGSRGSDQGTDIRAAPRSKCVRGPGSAIGHKHRTGATGSADRARGLRIRPHTHARAACGRVRVNAVGDCGKVRD